MLPPGLTASLRGTLQFRATASSLRIAAPAGTATSPARHVFASSYHLSLSTSSVGTNLHLHRPLATSSSIFARLAPISRRREASHLQRRPSDSEPIPDFLHADLPPPPSDARQPSVFRAILFLLGFSSLAFTGAACYSLLDTQHIASELNSSRDVFANISSFFTDTSAQSDIWGSGITERRLMAAKKQETATRLGLRMQWLMGWCDQLHLPSSLTEVIGRSYLMAAERYLDLSPSQQVVVPIVALNAAVFGLWSIASIRRGGGMWRFMTNNFIHRPSSNRTRTMVTSVFSHQSFLHFLFNNVALWSIGGSALIVAAHRLPDAVPEASPTPHFLAFFASAGVFAATLSHLVSAIRFKRIAALHGLNTARNTVGRQASLGSSGAVYAALVMSACAFPDAKLGIIFLPFITVPIGMGVVGLVAADVAGVLFRWRMFDHWAHLGGAAFGWMYWHWGAEGWQRLKKVLVERMRLEERMQQM